MGKSAASNWFELARHPTSELGRKPHRPTVLSCWMQLHCHKYASSVYIGCRRSFCGDGVLNKHREECDGLDTGANACATYKPG